MNEGNDEWDEKVSSARFSFLIVMDAVMGVMGSAFCELFDGWKWLNKFWVENYKGIPGRKLQGILGRKLQWILGRKL